MGQQLTQDVGNGIKATVVSEGRSCRWYIFRIADGRRTVLEEKRARNPEEAWQAIDQAKRKWYR